MSNTSHDDVPGDRMLEEVGLSPEQERVYRALIQLTEARADEVAARAQVTPPTAYTLLSELVTAGVVAVVSGSDAAPLFRPLSPDVTLGTALVRRQQALEAARKLVAQLTEEFRAGQRRRDADQLVELVHGRAALRQRIQELQDTVQQEALFFCRANPVALPSEENTAEFGALARGVTYRVVYERPLLDEPGMVDNVAHGIRCGEQARVLPSVPVRLGIIDRSLAVCPLVPDGAAGEPTAAVVGRSQLLDALLALFESYWERASPVHLGTVEPSAGGSTASSGHAPSGHVSPEHASSEQLLTPPDEEERLLLSLFVAGMPDKAVASQLGVSRRTVQRRLGDLMVRAGVDTRPGLAYQASQRGWL